MAYWQIEGLMNFGLSAEALDDRLGDADLDDMRCQVQRCWRQIHPEHEG